MANAYTRSLSFRNGKIVKSADCDVSSCEDVELKLVHPKFKVGDIVYNSYDNFNYRVVEVFSNSWGYTYRLYGLGGRVHEKYLSDYGLIKCKQEQEEIFREVKRLQRELNRISIKLKLR